jgi:hypothetical protein
MLKVQFKPAEEDCTMSSFYPVHTLPRSQIIEPRSRGTNGLWMALRLRASVDKSLRHWHCFAHASEQPLGRVSIDAFRFRRLVSPLIIRHDRCLFTDKTQDARPARGRNETRNIDPFLNVASVDRRCQRLVFTAVTFYLTCKFCVARSHICISQNCFANAPREICKLNE